MRVLVLVLTLFDAASSIPGMCASAEACTSLHALFTAATMGHVNRTVQKTATGYVAITTGSDETTVARLHSHVEAMRRRVVAGDAIHTADPLFDAIFREGGVCAAAAFGCVAVPDVCPRASGRSVCR